MKIPAAVLAALLLVAMCQGAEAELDSALLCCFRFTRRAIPRSMIASAYTTSSNCSMPGVILVTKTQRHVCADPRARWVQNYLKHFQALKN